MEIYGKKVFINRTFFISQDFHAHLSISEVVGYLGGTCDENKRSKYFYFSLEN